MTVMDPAGSSAVTGPRAGAGAAGAASAAGAAISTVRRAAVLTIADRSAHVSPMPRTVSEALSGRAMVESNASPILRWRWAQ